MSGVRLARPDPAGAPAYAQIEDTLAEAIADGALQPGHRLPAERELAGQLGVSRMTLRHALEALERRGLVHRSVGRGGGTFVATPKVEHDLTAFAGFSEQLRRSGVVAGARVLWAATEPASKAVAIRLAIDEREAVHVVTRIRLGNGIPLALERSWFPAGRFPSLLAGPLEGSLYDLLEERFGDRPVRALERLEAVVATAEQAVPLGVSEGSPLMLVERTAYSRQDVPLEFARDLFRGDRSRIVVWVPSIRDRA